MKEDTTRAGVRVVFRMWRGQVIALFPDVDEGFGDCLSYQHIGQHGGADYNGIIAESKPALPSEFADLAEELTNMGYNLVLGKRK